MRIVEEYDENNNKVEYTYFPPVWPDDYLFFGQTLSYGYDTRNHQNVPSSYDTANSVLRAPAYFRSYKMDVAHFNPDAVIVGKEKLTKEQTAANVTAREAYPDMTAIDFTGYNDVTKAGTNEAYGYLEGWSKWSKTSQLPQSSGMSDKKFFFPPLLDEGVTESGLSSITIEKLTQNLLVYTDEPGSTGSNAILTGSQKTANVVSGYLTDESYTDHETNSSSHTVAAWDSYANAMHGHWVYKSVDGYTTDRDHYLADKQDFNAPMAYTFQSGQRMWHQRLPEKYVDRKMGWEAISLPFTAEIVTTSEKGEITHFYNGSYDYFKKDKGDKGDPNADSKVGHEYWLREFTGKLSGSDPVVADFKYPVVSGDGSVVLDEKTVENTFLYDYYYKGENHEQLDHNLDTYQEYYSGSRTYEDYPLLTRAVPYIIGFPGETYYEFDLSGSFVAATTAETKPVKLSPQTITFASQLATTIGVSDDEMVGVTEKHGNMNYTFKPNYLNMKFEAGTNNYTLQSEYDSNNDNEADISRFGKVPDTGVATPVAAFRPYFKAAAASGARPVTRSIIFGNDDSEIKGVVEHGNPKEETAGTLNIYAKKHLILVESALTYTTDVRIVNLAGMTVNTFTIEPGETIETRIYNVQSTDGRHIKKLSVR